MIRDSQKVRKSACRRRLVAAGAIVIALAGCGAVPTQNYYVLTPLATSSNAGSTRAAGGIAVYIDRAHLPDVVDRPQFVVTLGENRVTILEQQRWAEPLRAAIPQVLALDLAQQLDGARVTAAPQDTIPDDAWRLSLDVQRFESRPADSVLIAIAWTLRRGGETKSQLSVAREPSPSAGYDALVAAHSRALGRISHEIADALGTAIVERK